MNSHRRLIAAAFVVALSGLSAPALADAGSLLSGYGGPGQGSQVILGSTLLNGGGGSSHGGSGGSSGEAASTGSGAGGSLEASAPSPAARHRQGVARAHRPAAGSTVGAPARAQEKPAIAVLARSAVQESHVGDPVLGISAADLVYILLALAVLVVTAVLTRAIARPSRGNGPAG